MVNLTKSDQKGVWGEDWGSKHGICREQLLQMEKDVDKSYVWCWDDVKVA